MKTCPMKIKCLEGFPTCPICIRNVVYEIRPLPNFREVRRYANGKWIEDDGEWDLAFIGLDDFAPVCYMFEPDYQKNIKWSYCEGMNWQAHNPKHPRGNAWHYELIKGQTVWGGDWGRDSHPNYIAGRLGMDENCKRYSCSNARHAEFQIYNPFIKLGLLREEETQRIIKFPEAINCMYCGELPVEEPSERKVA